MSASPLIPQVFWFRLAFPCRRIDALPRAKGRLLDLPDDCRLPSGAQVEGRPTWAEVRTAWNPEGLAIAVEVFDKPGPISHDPHQPALSDGVNLWIDTRDTRDVHRATRFCHRYLAQLVPTGRNSDPDVAVASRPIHRALADPPKSDPHLIRSRAERSRKGYRLELFLPASTLHGFDPDTNRRLGFAYEVIDPDRGSQHLAAGREFPIGEDPSLWSTLELKD